MGRKFLILSIFISIFTINILALCIPIQEATFEDSNPIVIELLRGFGISRKENRTYQTVPRLMSSSRRDPESSPSDSSNLNQINPINFKVQGTGTFIEDYVDNQDSNVDSVSDVGDLTDFDNMKDTDNSYANLSESAGGGAITKAGTDTTGTGTASPLSFSHTLVSGSNRMILVTAQSEANSANDISATYGGQTMVEAITQTTGTTTTMVLSIFYILEANLPSDGANTVSVTYTGTVTEVNAWCGQWDGVSQTTPEATDETVWTFGTTIANTISPSTDAWVISTVGYGNSLTSTHGQSQVEVHDFADGSSGIAVAELRGASGETSLDSTASGTINRGVRLAASFQPVAGSADYQMDQEVQFVGVYESPIVNEELRIKTGTFGGTENLSVSYWDGSSWQFIANLTASSWNNFTISDISVTEPYFTIKFEGGNTSGDDTQDWWMIDAVLVYVEEHVATTIEDYVDNQNSDMDFVADVGDLTNFDNLKDTDNSYANLSESVGGGGGNILFVDSVQATSTTQTVVLPAPTVSDGDFMVAVIGMPDDDPVAPITMTTVPSGWNEAVGKTNMDTLAVSPPAVWVYTKVASSESGTYTWAGTNSPLGTGSVGVLYVFSGVNSTLGTYGIINTLKSSQTGTGNDPVAPSITTVVGDTVMAFAWNDNGLQTVTTFPSSDGLTGEESPSIDPPTGNNGMTLSAGYEGNVTGTTSGTYSWTISAIEERSAFTFNIRPASGSSSDYNIDHEVQFVGVYDSPLIIEQLCIKTGTFGGTENLNVTYWDGNTWQLLTSELNASSWNNFTLVSVTSPTFTIKFGGSTTSSDSTQDWWEIDSVLLKVESPEDVLGNDSGFIWLDTPDELDLGTTYGSWVQQDLSDDSVPSHATGVILAWVEDSTTSRHAVARGSQDTNDFMNSGATYCKIEAETWKMQVVKLSDHKYIDTWRESAFERLYVMGYTVGSDPQFRRVAADLGSLTANSSWNKITLNGVNETTTGVILFGQSTSSQDATILVRAVDSTDSMTSREWEEYNSGVFFVKIDPNDQFEYYITSGRSAKFFLIAEVKNSIGWLETNRTSISATSAGWTIRDLDSYVPVPLATSGVILQHESTGGFNDYRNIAREYGQTWTLPDYDVGGDQWMMGGSGIDSENRIQIYAENLEQNVYIHALTLFIDKSAPIIDTLGVDDPGTGTATFWANLTDQSVVDNVTLTVNGTEYQMSNNGSFWTKDLTVKWQKYYTYQITNASDIFGNFLMTPSNEQNHSFTYDSVVPTIIDWEYYQGPDGTWDNQNNTFLANVSDSWGEIDTVILEVTTYSLTAVMTQYQNLSGILGYINDTLDLPNGGIDFRIIVNDTNGNEITSTIHSDSVFYNHPPIASDLTLSSAPYYSNTSLILDYTYWDEDSHPQSGTEINWYKNGELQAYTGLVISRTVLTKRNNWSVTIRPSDGIDFGDVISSANITIQNTAPFIQSLDLTVIYDIQSGQSLELSYTWIEADSGDTDHSLIQWYKDNGSGYILMTAFTNDTQIPASATQKGDKWRVNITASDSYGTGNSLLSSEVIITNTAPYLEVDINDNTVPATVATDQDLIANYTYFDGDDDPINSSSLEYQWYKFNTTSNQFEIFTTGTNTIFEVDTTVGELWRVEIRVNDGTNSSGWISSATISIGIPPNNPPSAILLNLTLSNAVAEGFLYISYTFSDPDPGDTESTSLYRWYRNGVYQPQFDGIRNLTTGTLVKGDSWYAEVRPRDDFDYGEWNQSSVIIIGNTAPIVSFGEILPTTAYTTSTLIANFGSTDIDSDLVIDYIIIWKKGGKFGTVVDNLENKTEVTANYTTKGEWWTYGISVFDSTDWSPFMYPEDFGKLPLIIQNSKPWIDPYSITITGGLTTSDFVNVTYSWYDDDLGDTQGATTFEWENSTYITSTSTNEELASFLTRAGEIWTVTIVPHDGTEFGEEVNSKSYGINIIIGNTPPEITGNEIKIQGYDPINVSYSDGVAFGTNLDLVVRYNVTDIDGLQGVVLYDVLLVDGYALGSGYRWFRNRSNQVTLISALSGMTTVPSSFTERDDLWWVEITPRDLYGDFGTPKNSTEISIINTAPYISGLLWDRTNFYASDDLSFNYIFADHDQSDVELGSIIEWYLYGINQTGFYNFVSISSENLTKGETWFARIKVWDGYLYSIWYYLSNITILNTAPVASNILLTPVLPTAAQDFVVFWNYSDDDNDSQQTPRIRWYKNNMLQSNLNDLDTVDASYLSKNDLWYVTVEVFDGDNYSLMITSTSLTILNSPPILTNAVLWNNNDLSNTSFSDGSISIYYFNYTDVDNDLVNTIFIQWYRNGIHLSLFDNQTTISSSALQKGDSWSAIIQIIDIDGTVWSNNLTSQVISVINKAPDILEFIYVGNEYSGFLIEDESIIISLITIDPDINDIDSSFLEWYLNGVYQPQFDNMKIIESDETTPGDIWIGKVTPSDGIDNGTVVQLEILIESRPTIHEFHSHIFSELEGLYQFAVKVNDTLDNQIVDVRFEVFLNGSTLPTLNTITNFPNETGYWILPYELHDYIFLNTNATVKVTVRTSVEYSEVYYYITNEMLYNFTLVDKAPPRVIYARFTKDDERNPTSLTFYAEVEEFGLNVSEVVLYYYFVPLSETGDNAGLGATVLQTELYSTMNLQNISDNIYLFSVTVDFQHEQSDTEIHFRISTRDTDGNINELAFDNTGLPDQTFFYQPPGLPEEVLWVAGLVIFVIFVGSIVYVKFIRKPELVGLDKELVLQKIADIKDAEILTALDTHTLGVVVSFFDQRHGPIPVIVLPELLKDNFSKLVELSDRSFSGTGFGQNFTEEIPSNFDFVLGESLRTGVMSFGFAVEKPEARGGQENLTLNILIQKDVSPLLNQFQDEIQDKVHSTHMFMNEHPSEKEKIRKRVFMIRKFVCAIVLSYQNIYGTIELLSEEE